MSNSTTEILTTPRRDDLGLLQIANSAGVSVSLLPSGAIFAIEHVDAKRRIMINQVLASPIANGIGRLFLRTGGPEPAILPVIGPEAGLRVGAADDRVVWEGEESGVGHRVTLWLHPRSSVWLWRLEVVNRRDRELSCDAVFLQDLGLGDQGFLMNNEAYVSQYLDHHVAQHPRLNHVVMSRQNLSQGGTYPWIAHGCLEGAAGFATDVRDVMGPSYRDADRMSCGFGDEPPVDAPSVRDRMRSLAVEARDACARRRRIVDILRPLRARSPGGVERRRPQTDRCGRKRRQGLDDARRRPVSPAAQSSARRAVRGRRGARREGDPDALPQAHACRAGRRPALVFLHAGENAQPSCRLARQGADRRASPRRPRSQRRRDAAGRDDVVRDGMDAWRVRGAAHHRQYVFPQALFRLPRSLQHHPRAADCGC